MNAPRYPEVTVRLSDLRFPVTMLSLVSAELRKAGVPEEERQELNALPLPRDPDEMRSELAKWVTVK